MRVLAKRASWLAVIAVLVSLASASTASAATKPFRLVICVPGETCTAPPNSSSAVGSALVPPGTTGQTMTATFTNENKPNTGLNLGSANLTPPPGFTINSATVTCAGCTATVDSSGILELRGLGLVPGATAMVTMNDNAPSSGYTTQTAWQAANQWSVVAKQSNDFSGSPGNNLALDTGASALDTVLTNLTFNVEPANAQRNTNITGTPYSQSGSPIEVRAVDTVGNPVTWFSGTVTLALDNNPTGANFSSGSVTSVQAGNGGIAQFNKVALDTDGYGYTLSASSPNVNGTTSTGFDIHDQGTSVNCSGNKCSSSLTQTGTVSQTTQINASGQLTGGLLTVALDNGVDYWTQTVATQCGGYVPLGPDTAIFDLLNASGAKTIVDTVTETVSSGSAFKALVANQEMCLAATSDFVSKSGDPLNGNLAEPAFFPDGVTPGFVGLVSDCANVDPTTTPCVTNRTGTYKQQTAKIEIDVSIPAGFAGDPLRGH